MLMANIRKAQSTVSFNLWNCQTAIIDLPLGLGRITIRGAKKLLEAQQQSQCSQRSGGSQPLEFITVTSKPFVAKIHRDRQRELYLYLHHGQAEQEPSSVFDAVKHNEYVDRFRGSLPISDVRFVSSPCADWPLL
jgi:hypothetical protein